MKQVVKVPRILQLKSVEDFRVTCIFNNGETRDGYFTQSLPAFQRKVYHPKGVVEADINLVNFFGS
jgi:hypothetical protein